MRYITVLLIACLLSTVARAADGPHPYAPPQLSELAFFIGEWDIDSHELQRDGSYVVRKARSSVSWALDGMAIQDEFRSIHPEGHAVFWGVSFRTWDRANGRYAIKWVMANTDGMTDIHASWINGELVMEGDGYDDGGAFLERARYYDITENSYRFRLSRSYDDGATWIEDLNRIEATRIE